MERLPHLYRVEASARPEGPVALDSSGLEALSTAPPVQYDGPGDRWSPETLFIGAVVDCFALTSLRLRASLTVPQGTDPEKAARLLHKAEEACLITNSLTCSVTLEPNVSIEGQSADSNTDRALQ